jgi:hypothetical protein
VARALAELPPTAERNHLSRHDVARRARQALARLPLHRVLGAVELSLAALVVAVVDAATGGTASTRVLTFAAAVIALVVAVGHAFTILTSDRLR